MVEVYFDPSFIVPLYVPQIFTQHSMKYVEKTQVSFALNHLQIHEVKNALRLCCFRKLFTEAQAKQAVTKLEKNIGGELIQVEWQKAFAEADKIGAAFTPKEGIRSFDLLHLAIARTLKASKFATYDKKQARLAQKLGFSIISAE